MTFRVHVPRRQDRRLAIEEGLRRRISDDEFRFSFARSGGPGGQNVNKVNTKVTLWFDLDTSPGLTADERDVLRNKLAPRIGSDGRLRFTVSRFRTQGANRIAAVEYFYQVLADALVRAPTRKPTKKPRNANRRRLASKKLRSARKAERRPRHQDDE